MLFTGYKHKLLTIVNNVVCNSQTDYLHVKTNVVLQIPKTNPDPKFIQKKSPSVSTGGGSEKYAFLYFLYPYTASSPRASSILRSWLYLHILSVLLLDPVLIWPELTATAKSAIVESSVSPERCEMTVV